MSVMSFPSGTKRRDVNIPSDADARAQAWEGRRLRSTGRRRAEELGEKRRRRELGLADRSSYPEC